MYFIKINHEKITMIGIICDKFLDKTKDEGKDDVPKIENGVQLKPE